MKTSFWTKTLVFIFLINIFTSNNANAGAISNWFNGLVDIKKPKQHKNSFYIAGGYVYNTNLDAKIYQSGNLIARQNGKASGGHGFNISIGYRHNFGNFFISPELSFTSTNIGMFKNIMVSNTTYGSDVQGYAWHEDYKYYNNVYLKRLIVFSIRFGAIFWNRLLAYGRFSIPAIMLNDYSHFGSISDYGYGLGIGAGFEFNIATNLFIRLEYNYYITFKSTDVNNDENSDGAPLKIKQNLGLLNLSLGFNFNVDDC